MNAVLLLPLLGAAACTADMANTVVAPSDAASSGTGFFVRQDGVLVTAAHVVAGCHGVKIASMQVKLAAARVVDIDEATDLAVLRADRVQAPGVVGLGRGLGPRVAYGYPVTWHDSPLRQVSPADITDRVTPPPADPRFAIWWQDEGIAHGWSGGPVVQGGQVAGVILAVVPDLQETARVLGRPERGVAAGASAASVGSLLARAGVQPGPPYAPRDAVVRVFCLG